MTYNMATTTRTCWHFNKKYNEIAWIKCAGHTSAAELKRKVSFFRIARFDRYLFVCFFLVFHHKDAENLLSFFISDVP